MGKRWQALLTAALIGATGLNAQAWDHPGHMTTAAIAFSEIEKARPDLIEKIGQLILKHPDPAPFWVAMEDAKGNERVRRMFIQGSRWPDDVRWTIHDRPAWHSARWAIVAGSGEAEKYRYRSSNVLIKEDGRWQAVASHVSGYEEY